MVIFNSYVDITKGYSENEERYGTLLLEDPLLTSWSLHQKKWNSVLDATESAMSFSNFNIVFYVFYVYTCLYHIYITI